MAEASLFPEESPRDPEGFVDEAFGIMRHAVEQYRPTHIFAMFSGGHDSLCATHVAATFGGMTAAVHINTGVGVEETREFVRQTCKEHDWPLLEYHPPPYTPGRCKRCRKQPKQARSAWQECSACVARRRPGIDYENLPAYEAITLHHGFCGPGGHTLIYNRLKERCIRRLVREHKRKHGDRIMLVGGMRQAESVRRMGNAEAIGTEGSRVWCAPLVYWTTEDKNAYIDMTGLKRNPVVERLCMSGECLCGAFARPYELVEIAHHYPRAAEYIRSLEVRAREAGVHATWGTKHPNSKCEKRKQDDPRQLNLFTGLCWSCANKWEKPQ